eukprot:792252-Rhodomonas_salina.3
MADKEGEQRGDVDEVPASAPCSAFRFRLEPLYAVLVHVTTALMGEQEQERQRSRQCREPTRSLQCSPSPLTSIADVLR